MKDFLQGKPLKHPLHPLLVHFPIALFAISFTFDVASLIWPEFGGLVQGAFYTMALGVVTALLAAIPGFVDYADIRNDHPAKKIATTHMLLNLVAVAIYAANVGLRWSALNEGTVRWLPFIVSLAALTLLSVSGYLGGVMVYDKGIGVGRHRRKTDTPENTINVSSQSARKLGGFVEVADANTLREGETLRVELDGTVMAIAKLDGQIYAFQEFCTHRFGPLSEGSFHDGKVQCPWHCSCFDVRTGKVTSGPAKVDLKTFATRVEEGKILIAPPQKIESQFIAPSKRPCHRWKLFDRKEVGS